jgi:hypothetical protein
LIAAQLQGKNPHVAKIKFEYAIFDILKADAELLSKLAGENKVALELLLVIPTSPLGISLKGNDPQNPFQAKLRQEVAQRLAAVGKDKPETRKTIMPYFVALLQSADVEDRVTGASSLASFGPDASAALPALKKLSMDPSEQVRDAVRDAIAKIEKANK